MSLAPAITPSTTAEWIELGCKTPADQPVWLTYLQRVELTSHFGYVCTSNVPVLLCQRPVLMSDRFDAKGTTA